LSQKRKHHLPILLKEDGRGAEVLRVGLRGEQDHAGVHHRVRSVRGGSVGRTVPDADRVEEVRSHLLSLLSRECLEEEENGEKVERELAVG